MCRRCLGPIFCLILLVLLGCSEQGSTDSTDSVAHALKKESKTKFTGLYTGPYFDQIGNPPNVTVQLGETALLPCRVKQLGKNFASWVRIRDSYIIAVETDIFIEDDRFFVLQDAQDPEQWALYIRHVSPRDSGVYECQISTVPKMSRKVNLVVKDTRVEIVGSSDVHANSGSRVEFKCRISGTLQKPAFVFWYHGKTRLMPLETEGMSSSLKSVEAESDSAFTYEAVLTLSEVRREQSGNYSCSPSNTKPVSVRLHIIDGEIRAAMSDGVSSAAAVHLTFRDHRRHYNIFILIFLLPLLAFVTTNKLFVV